MNFRDNLITPPFAQDHLQRQPEHHANAARLSRRGPAGLGVLRGPEPRAAHQARRHRHRAPQRRGGHRHRLPGESLAADRFQPARRLRFGASAMLGKDWERGESTKTGLGYKCITVCLYICLYTCKSNVLLMYTIISG